MQFTHQNINIRLAIVTTHPIQYYAPVFKQLSKKFSIKVFYTWERGTEEFDTGFNQKITWDIPILEGYDYTFVSNDGNRARGFLDLKNPSLIEEVKVWEATAVLVYGWNYLSHLRVMLYFKGKIPVLFRGDSHVLDHKKTFKTWLRKKWLTWVYRHVDFALYVGTNNKIYFQVHGLNENQLVFAPHAVDNERFMGNDDYFEKEALLLRRQLGISMEEIVVLFAGKLEPKKNPQILLKAIQLLNRRKINPIRLLIVGNGQLEQELKKQGQSDPNIIFLDFQNQSKMPVVYHLGNIFCLPSSGPGETWGLSVNEAMASGRPVLVSNKVGCAVDLVVEGKTGYIFNSGDQKDLIDKLKVFSRQVDLEQAILRHNAKITVSSWSFERQVDAIEHILLKKNNFV